MRVEAVIIKELRVSDSAALDLIAENWVFEE